MDKALEARRPDGPNRWSEEEVETALRILAMNGGAITRSAEMLAGEGLPIPRGTLSEWKTKSRAVQYEKALSTLREEIGHVVSDRAMAIATHAATVEAELVMRAGETLGDLEPKELTKAALNLAILKKNNVETARVLRNEPTVVVGSKDVGDTLDSLRQLGIINQKESPGS